MPLIEAYSLVGKVMGINQIIFLSMLIQMAVRARKEKSKGTLRVSSRKS